MTFPASSNQSGMAQGLPDVCKVPAPPAPPVPTPFPNIGQCMQATGGSTKVLLMNMQCLTIKAKIPMSQGDEAGVAGGVKSGVNMNQVMFKKGSAKVAAEGAAVVHLTAMTGHNGTSDNVPGQQIAPSQTKVLVK